MATKTRKKSSVGRKPKTTYKIGGKRYKKKSCHTTKNAAKSAAKKLRKGGRYKSVRVVGKCVAVA
jgi:hypothetical protein